MPQTEESQVGMFDVDLSDDDELYEALTTIQSTKGAAKRLRKALLVRKERVKAREAEFDDTPEYHEDAGVRIRCREFVLTVKPRSGGGIEIPEWTTAVVAKQEQT